MNPQKPIFLKNSILLAFFFLAVFPGRAFCKPEISNNDCLNCHDSVKIKAYNNSAHGSSLQCVSCHTDIKELPHAEKPTKVSCASCHSNEAQIYYASDHGKSNKAGSQSAGCLDCHGKPHEILSASKRESPIYHLNIPFTCGKCHEDEKKMAKYDLSVNKPVLTYSNTVHGKAISEKRLISAAVCTDCHGSHNLTSPANSKSMIYRKNVPSTCGKCHSNVLKTYVRSIHGKSAMAGKPDAPVCTDCHSEHTIRSHKDPTSSVYATVIAKKTCGQCHAAERIISKYRLPANRLETYFQSYHGLAGKFGVTTVANCASCHGTHDILPSSDPASTVSKENLPKTCGKCHQNAGVQLSKGTIHLVPSSVKDTLVFYVTWFYILLILSTVGGMLVHNMLYFLPALKAHFRRHREEAKYIRFTKNERLQHVILLGSFILLAYTGFALRFRDAWWTVPFTMWSPGFDWRGIIHRVMAAIFSVLVVYHVWYLLWTQRGREQLKALLPGKKDFSYFFKMMAYNLGIKKQKPEHMRYNYTEKVEYWCLVWGTIVMLVTGSLLTFENFFFRYFDKWIFDVARAIHYYEAILAVLAILIWHMYFVIFDPANYPINLSMLTGNSRQDNNEEQDKKAHTRESS
jgi:formate dehydrogenase gamma subunit